MTSIFYIHNYLCVDIQKETFLFLNYIFTFMFSFGWIIEINYYYETAVKILCFFSHSDYVNTNLGTIDYFTEREVIIKNAHDKNDAV